MNKQRILDEIWRTATENGGAPPGKGGFRTETGIKESDWSGRFWARWGDAVREAGLTPNTLNSRSEEDEVFEQLATFVREFGRYPTDREMRLRKRQMAAFPNPNVLKRLGTRHELVQRLSAFCERTGDWSDVVALCQTIVTQSPEPASDDDGLETGYVYLALMKVGRERRYKIGKANIVEQRARQIAVNFPEELELIHAIGTDDAYGIEAYWHQRFAGKRRGGEWSGSR